MRRWYRGYQIVYFALPSRRSPDFACTFSKFKDKLQYQTLGQLPLHREIYLFGFYAKKPIMVPIPSCALSAVSIAYVCWSIS